MIIIPFTVYEFLHLLPSKINVIYSELSGSAVLQKKVEYDLGTLLGNILDFYGIWAADNESNSQIFADEKTRQLTRVSV